MSIYNPKTTFTPARSGFDLTFRSTFSSCGGQLLPVMTKWVQPGDKFRLNIAHLTNAENLNKAAFARLEEHYDVFFVPVRQLWSYWPEFIVMTDQPTRMDRGGWSNASSGKVPKRVPYFSASTFASHVADLEGSPSSFKDELGFPLHEGIQKLLDYLGYSHKFTNYFTGSIEQEYVNAEPNLWNALAYQKIYNDFYRDANWERPSVGSFNVDDYDDSNSSNPALVSNVNRLQEIFKMRYVNLKKDYFTGLRPSPTFGDVSVVTSSYLGNKTNTAQSGSSAYAAGVTGPTGVPNGQLYLGSQSPKIMQADIDMLELRKAQALQRWKDVTLSNRKDYASQITAHFGEKVRQPFSNTVQFIDGFTSNMNIDQITSTNSQASASPNLNDLQVARGGSLNGFDDGSKTIEFESKDEYGVFMVMYYVLPLPDVSAFGIDRFNLKAKAEDYFIPEFENLGLQPVEQYELDIARLYGQGQTLNYPLGYSNRYLEYKGAFDVVHDSFVLGGSRQQYVITFNPQQTNTQDTDYTYFKANPHMLDNIFAVPYNGSRDTENFRNTTYFSLKVIRNMSVDGMPY